MKSTYDCSPRDILFLQFISRMATLFGIIPSYDYKKQKLTYKKLYRCFTLCSVCIVISVSWICFYRRCILYKNSPVMLKVMDFLVDMMGVVLYTISSVSSSSWNMKTWDKLINKLYKLEELVNLNTRGTRNNSLGENRLIHFIVGSLIFAVLVVCQLFFNGLTIFPYYIPLIILQYVKYVLISIIYNVTVSIKSKYEHLNNMLLDTYSTTASCKNTVKLIQKIRILNLRINSSIDTFNSFFGWPLLLLIAHSFVQILACVSLLTTNAYQYVICEQIVLLYYLIVTVVS